MAKFDAGWIGWISVIVTMGFFYILRKVSAHLFSIPPGIIRGYGDDYRVFRWRNLIISFLHAIITGCWALICVMLYGKQMRGDMVAFVNWPTYGLCCFTTGYFLYDAMDIIKAKRIFEKWDILLHHMTILISAAYVVTYAECVGYQAFGMLVEINTIFLHRRQLYQLAGTDRADPAFRRNTYFNISTFVVFRCFPLCYLTVGIFFDGHRVPRWYLIFYGSCMALLNVINAILFYRLIRADFLSILNGLHCNGGNNPQGHKKVNSTVGCCESLNMRGSDYIRPKIAEEIYDEKIDTNDDGLRRRHFDSNVLKDVTKMNDGVHRAFNLAP